MIKSNFDRVVRLAQISAVCGSTNEALIPSPDADLLLKKCHEDYSDFLFPDVDETIGEHRPDSSEQTL